MEISLNVLYLMCVSVWGEVLIGQRRQQIYVFGKKTNFSYSRLFCRLSLWFLHQHKHVQTFPAVVLMIIVVKQRLENRLITLSVCEPRRRREEHRRSEEEDKSSAHSRIPLTNPKRQSPETRLEDADRRTTRRTRSTSSILTRTNVYGDATALPGMFHSVTLNKSTLHLFNYRWF
ncbi:hypothetical protein NL108_017687 [Boleophthalmus pectinirostris]|nr:hypothetical protein NL108_017687 [Boleophthalmus pectinirostris]